MELKILDTTVQIGNKVLKNPVGAASGTFGYGAEYKRLMDVNQVGAIYTKAVTLNPRIGNPTPRIAETPAGMLNAIGLANVGIDNFIKIKTPFLKGLNTSVIVNVAGSDAQEYYTLVERLEEIPFLFGYEINLSCPNVKKGCLSFGTDPFSVEELTRELRKRTTKPLIIKLTPNVTDITQIAKAAENGGADAVSCINTLVGMSIDINKKKPVLANGTGGLSGPAIKPVGIAAVYRVSRAVKIPVIGIGGIASGSDAVEYLLAGAKAIQVGTATFSDPGVMVEIERFIVEYMEKENLNCIDDFAMLMN